MVWREASVSHTDVEQTRGETNDCGQLTSRAVQFNHFTSFCVEVQLAAVLSTHRDECNESETQINAVF